MAKGYLVHRMVIPEAHHSIRKKMRDISKTISNCQRPPKDKYSIYRNRTIKAGTVADAWVHSNKQHFHGQSNLIIDSQLLLLATQKTAFGCDVC
jgi:hypothetical protein